MSKKRGESPFDQPSKLLRSSDPIEVARRAHVGWDANGGGGGRFSIPVLNGSIKVGYPEISVQADAGLDSFTLKLLAVLYLSNSSGVEPSGEWVAYRELAGGRFYEPVLERSVERPIASRFANDVQAFREAADCLGGRLQDFGDASCSFALFPLVPIVFILWKADEEFPERARVLFDSNCIQHLGAFDLRMGAQEISGRLISHHRQQLPPRDG